MITWIENADVSDAFLSEWLNQFSSVDRKNFTHRPDKEDEYRIMGYDNDKLIVYGFLGKTSSFGYIIKSEYRNKKLGHEIMKKILDYAKRLGMKIINTEVFCNNHESLKIMLDVGFKCYGPIYLLHKELS